MILLEYGAPEETQEELFKRYPILKVMSYIHLPERLQRVSKPFGDLAWTLAQFLPHNAETSTMLRKLREAKDCAVGALILEA